MDPDPAVYAENRYGSGYNPDPRFGDQKFDKIYC
jgi:hypothetical protein